MILLPAITVLIAVGIYMLSFYSRKPVNAFAGIGQDVTGDYKTEVIKINVKNGNNRIVGQMHKTEAVDLTAVLEELKKIDYVDKKRIYLSGHSQSGFVSTIVGAKRPDDIRGMFILSPAYFIHDSGIYTAFISDMMQLWSMTVSKKYFKDASDYDLFGGMKNFKGKVIIYHGTSDEMAHIRYLKKALNYFPNAELYTIEGAHHDYTSDEEVMIQNDIIRRILEDK